MSSTFTTPRLAEFNAPELALSASGTIVETKPPLRAFDAEMLDALAADTARWSEIVGDAAQRNALLERIDALVTPKTIAGLTRRYGLADSPDLRQHALIALNGLIESHVPERGSLSAYLGQFHPLRTIDELRKNGEFSRSEVQFHSAYSGAKHRLADQGVAQPTAADIAAEMGSGEAAMKWKVQRLHIRSARPLSSFERDGKTFDVAAPESIAAGPDAETRRYFARILAPLPENERFVISLRFCENFSLQEIDTLLGKSKGHAACLSSQGLKRLAEIYGQTPELLSPDLPGAHLRAPAPDLQVERSPTFRSFIRELRTAGVQTERSALEAWVDGPAFMAEFIRSKEPAVRAFRRGLVQAEPQFVEKLRPDARAATAAAFQGLIGDLDAVEAAPELLAFAGVQPDPLDPLSTRDLLRRRLVELELLSAERPARHPVIHGRFLSTYVRPEIVGPAAAERNVRAVLRERFPTLDDVREETLGGGAFLLLGLSKPSEVPRAIEVLIRDHGFSTTLPRQHPCPDERLSRYLDPAIVGAEAFADNRARWFRDNVPTLDAIPTTHRVGRLLGTESIAGADLARRAIDLELLSPYMPAEHPPTAPGGKLSHYLNSAVVADESILRRNAARFIASHAHLDGFDAENGYLHLSAKLAGVPVAPRAVAAWAVREGIMAPGMPPEHPLRKGNYASAYVDPAVVGFEQARENLAAWVKRSVVALDNISEQTILVQALHLTRAPGEAAAAPGAPLARALIERGLVSPAWPAGHDLPHRPPYIYFDAAAVGEPQAQANFRSFVRGDFPTLDHVNQSAPHFTALASMLGVSREPLTVVKTLLERGLLDDTTLPTDHPIGRGRFLSFYCRPDVVGCERARENTKMWVAREVKVLTDLPMINLLTEALNVTRAEREPEVRSPRDAAAELVRRYWASPIAPANYTPSTKSAASCLYLDPAVVGEAAAKLNYANFVERGVRGIKNLPPLSGLPGEPLAGIVPHN